MKKKTVGRALELFSFVLTNAGLFELSASGQKKLQPFHLRRAVNKLECLDFVRKVFENVYDPGEKVAATEMASGRTRQKSNAPPLAKPSLDSLLSEKGSDMKALVSMLSGKVPELFDTVQKPSPEAVLGSKRKGGGSDPCMDALVSDEKKAKISHATVKSEGCNKPGQTLDALELVNANERTASVSAGKGAVALEEPRSESAHLSEDGDLKREMEESDRADPPVPPSRDQDIGASAAEPCTLPEPGKTLERSGTEAGSAQLGDTCHAKVKQAATAVSESDTKSIAQNSGLDASTLKGEAETPGSSNSNFLDLVLNN